MGVKDRRTQTCWQAAKHRLPNPFELYCLIFAAGALWYVPRALEQSGPEPDFVWPTRGGTRAFGRLFEGDVVGAVVYNPFAVALAALLLLGVGRWLLVLALGKRPVVVASSRVKVIAAIAVGCAIAANWVYVMYFAPWR